MTKKCRYEEEATPFSLWLREQKDLDSDLGFITTNVDYIWENYKSNKWMILEEKRYNGNLYFSQKNQMKNLHNSIESDNYLGFHLIIFENTTPEDGEIYLDYNEIDQNDLKEFLRFDKNESWYETSIFDKNAGGE